MPFGYIFGKHFANALRDLAVSMEFLIAFRPGSAGRVRTGPCGERMGNIRKNTVQVCGSPDRSMRRAYAGSAARVSQRPDQNQSMKRVYAGSVAQFLTG